jgi:hypothetical protein
MGGETIVYVPITKKNKSTFDNLVLSNTNTLKLFHDSSEPIGIPHTYKTYKRGNCLMFKSELYHIGNKYFGKKKECLMITINMMSISTHILPNTIKNNDMVYVTTIDNKKYVLPKSYLKHTLFPTMISFYNSNELNTELTSEIFEYLLKFILDGIYSNDNEVNELIQFYSGMSDVINECDIPQIYHKQIHEWLESELECIHFNNFEFFMFKFAEKLNLVPFQIFLCKSTVSGSENITKKIYYYNFDDDMNCSDNELDILSLMHNKIQYIYSLLKKTSTTEISNVKTRTLSKKNICKEILPTNNKFKFINLLNFEEIINKIIKYSTTLDSNSFSFFQKEEISGKTLETEWCNDSYYHYYEDTTIYFSCKIDVKYGFCKTN